jgi:hypothetical protein
VVERALVGFGPEGQPSRGSQTAAGFSPVAVRATDFAFFDLAVDTRPRPPGSGIGRNIGNLVAGVIELENDDVALAAVHARMLSEVLDDLLAHLPARRSATYL